MLSSDEIELIKHRLAQDTHGWRGSLDMAYAKHKAECASKGMLGSGYFSKQAGTITIDAYRELVSTIGASLTTVLADLDLSVTQQDETELGALAARFTPLPEEMRSLFIAQHPTAAFGQRPTEQTSAEIHAACATAHEQLGQEIRYILARHEKLAKRREEQHAMNIVFNGAANIGALQTGASSTANVQQTVSSAAGLADLLASLTPLIRSTSLPPEKKDEYVEVVEECAVAARSGTVNKSKVSMVLGALKGAAQAITDGQALAEAVTKSYEFLSNF